MSTKGLLAMTSNYGDHIARSEGRFILFVLSAGIAIGMLLAFNMYLVYSLLE